MRQEQRIDDMSRYARLSVMLDDEGDFIVTVIPDPFLNPDAYPISVEFCSSGGKSPATREALLNLLNAMEKDNSRSKFDNKRYVD